MNFIEVIVSGFKNYATFSGRACRSEFWIWSAFVILLGCVATVVDAKLNMPATFALVVQLGLLLPSLAVAARRLHDVDRSGWWLLLMFTVIGAIPLLYWYCKKGTAGDNRFGAAVA